mgnify:CR=1 FL=1
MLLDLSRSLYDLGAVEATALAFVELATFHVEPSEHHIQVRITDAHPSVADLVDHFTNHVLHATIVGRRRGVEGAG